jgi:hypothetical protein
MLSSRRFGPRIARSAPLLVAILLVVSGPPSGQARERD